MTDFSKILEKAKEIEKKMKESQENLKKIEVNGSNTHPLYEYLKSEKTGILTEAIKWNFTKFLVDRDGNVIKRYSPQTEPGEIEEELKDIIE